VCLVQVLDQRLGNDANEGVDNGVYDDTFNARDVEAQGEGALRRKRGHGVASKQSKANDEPSQQGVRLCFIAATHATLCNFATKQKNKKRENAKI
jgi:hypothetical protein